MAVCGLLFRLQGRLCAPERLCSFLLSVWRRLLLQKAAGLSPLVNTSITSAWVMERAVFADAVSAELFFFLSLCWFLRKILLFFFALTLQLRSFPVTLCKRNEARSRTG